MTEFDQLTGLYTREAFCKHAKELVEKNPHIKYDIVLSDFVNFKHFNERYGTQTGDYLLIKTGESLAFVPNAICGRYGADRFVSIVPHLEEIGYVYLENFQLPEKAKNELPVASIVVKFGVCTGVDGTLPISVYCDHAYLAVQSVKHQYGKNVGVYDDSMGQSILQEVIVEENMKSAIEEHQFEVYYQPKIDLKTNQICGAEALVRWIHPTLGFMNPGVFVPLFEKNGFITTMDLYVWEKVCQDIVEWKEKGFCIVPISVNVSRKDFMLSNLFERIQNLVNIYKIEPSLFHLEITESCYSQNPETVLNLVNQLHDAGFVIELDDFGAGYTSLSSLNDMRYDILKLDRSLLQKDKPNDSRSVLDFAMQLAKMMNLQTIQEGVETKEQVERLKQLNCDFVQGYYYSKPLPKQEFENYINN